MYIENNPVQHVIDEATAFQAARWLSNMSAVHIWKTLKLCWIHMHVGATDIIIHDAGTNFDTAEFRRNASSMTNQLKRIPVEAPQSVGQVERYHNSL